jgi:hypothetical protein
MQWDRTADVVVLSGTVRGLGVSDALCAELAPIQREVLEEQLEVFIADLERQAMRHEADALPNDDQAAEALSSARYQVRLARLMRDGLQRSDSRAPFAFVGPSAMVLDLVKSCLLAVVETLAQHLGGDEAELSARSLERVAEIAAAWVRTFCDCRAVESYSFDPGVDPVWPI